MLPHLPDESALGKSMRQNVDKDTIVEPVRERDA
jgi:hypothetical protein